MNSSRRNFLATGLALPAAASASRLATPEAQSKTATPAGNPLRYRVLGKTGLKVTTVGFGCMVTSDGSVIERAADIGINYFDTARSYSRGNNERMVGAALKNRRKDLVISTKTEAKGTDKAGALAQLDTSLKELGTDYVDIWYLHGKSSAAEITEELLEAQQEAKKAGKVRFPGVSTHGTNPDVFPVLVNNPKIEVILVTFNFSMDQQRKDFVAAAAKAGKGVVAMKVMAGGFRKATPGDPVQAKLKQEGAMVAALKWAVNAPGVHTTVPSMTDMEQLDANLKAMTSPFSGVDEKLLAEQLQHIQPLYCRMCGSCTGSCPKGVPVPDMLRFLSYAEGYGQFSLAREHFQQLPKEVADVRCNLCPTCSVECPNGVRVAERLIRAQELFA